MVHNATSWKRVDVTDPLFRFNASMNMHQRAPLASLHLLPMQVFLSDEGRGEAGAAQARLAAVRAGLSRAHGPNLERLKVLHGNFSPELAT